MSLLHHYRKLVFFARHRLEGDNYRLMQRYFAEIVIREISEFVHLQGRRVLDVGGYLGEFCRVLREMAGCEAINLDPQAPDEPGSIVGVAEDIPFPDASFDLVICRNVLEHIPPQPRERAISEIHRVLKAGGFAYVVIPPWYNPHAGHHLKPFHLLPFPVAKRLREFFFHNRIAGKSMAAEGLHPVTFRSMAKMLRRENFMMVATRDTHFRLHLLTRVPILREVIVPAAAFIVRKDITGPIYHS